MANPTLPILIDSDPTRVSASVWTGGGSYDPITGTETEPEKTSDLIVGEDTEAVSPTLSGNDFYIRFYGLDETSILSIDIDDPSFMLYGYAVTVPTYDETIDCFICEVDSSAQWIENPRKITFNPELSEVLPPDEPVIEPLNSVFYMDKIRIGELMNASIYVPYQDGFISRADFIVNLLELPFKIPEVLKGTVKDIKLGDLNTQVSAPVVLTELIYLDLGNIQVQGFKNNSLDFKDVKYSLNFPFTDNPIDLTPSEVVNRSINAVYVVDVYDGSSTINIYNGGVLPIRSIKTNIGRDAPIKMLREVVKNQGSDNAINNGINKMFIVETKPELSEGVYYNLVSLDGVLGNYSDVFVVVDDINLKVKATSNEIDLIKNILNSGVFINA